MPSSDYDAHRRYELRLAEIRARVLRDYLALWQSLDKRDLNRALPGFTVAVRGMLDGYRAQMDTATTAYLSAVRSASGVPGSLPRVAASGVDPEQLGTSLRVTIPAAYFTAVNGGASSTDALASALVQSAGAVTRLAMDAGRQAVIDSVRRDPHAVGWRRYADPGACKFCRMLADRVGQQGTRNAGWQGVYTESTATFAAHDHCNCWAGPVYGDKGTTRVASTFTPSARSNSSHERAILDKWMDAHGYTDTPGSGDTPTAQGPRLPDGSH